MKILLLGADGQVGYELSRSLPDLGKVVATSRRDLDFGDLEALRARVALEAPQVIVNAVAYNAVDRAESEPAVALRINAEAVGVLGEEAQRLGAALIHYSTDFVFDGTKDAPYTETDPTNPLSAYARSKLAGERALVDADAPAIILRTAWVYSLRRKSFVSIMLDLARQRQELRVVADQVGSPTWCRDLARATLGIISKLGPDPGSAVTARRGIYHAAGGGACSRYELATAAIDLDPKKHEHVVERIERASTADFPAPAARPSHAPLDCSKLGQVFGVHLLPWREALAEALADA